jgi:hypothetical protein
MRGAAWLLCAATLVAAFAGLAADLVGVLAVASGSAFVTYLVRGR